jgi:methionyl-tRNA synthetase
MINYEDFAKVELRTAKVLEANIHSNADKLYVLKIDLGDKTTQIVAGIRNYYTPEELIGKSVVIVANLEPKTIRGVESNGMLLAAHFQDQIVILMTEKDVLPGSIVK